MNDKQNDFTKKYTMSVRPGDGLGVLAAFLLILTPMLNPNITVGLGIALLILMGLCHFPRK